MRLFALSFDIMRKGGRKIMWRLIVFSIVQALAIEKAKTWHLIVAKTYPEPSRRHPFYASILFCHKTDCNLPPSFALQVMLIVLLLATVAVHDHVDCEPDGRLVGGRDEFSA